MVLRRLMWVGVILVLAALLWPAAGSWAQGSPRVTGVEPTGGKVGAQVTVTGENLGKANVVAVYLSDNNDDYKAAVVDQTSEKIVVKVPKVPKVGEYNVSIQIKNDILIQPVRFSVQE